MFLEECFKVRAIGLGALQQGMVRRARDHHQALLGEFLPSLHRTEGDKVMFRSYKQNGQMERIKAGLGRKPVSNDIHTTPMAAWVPWGVSR